MQYFFVRIKLMLRGCQDLLVFVWRSSACKHTGLL